MEPHTIKRPAFWVLIAPEGTDPDTITDDEATTMHVVVNSQDQLRAELEAPAAGLRKIKDQPFHLTALWLWAAMARTGQTELPWKDFKTRMLHYTEDKTRPAPHTAPPAELEADELDARPTAASTS